MQTDLMLRPRLRRAGRRADLPRRSTQLRLYVAGMLLLAVALLVVAPILLPHRDLDRPWLVAAFAALVALEGLLGVALYRNRGEGETLGQEEALLVFMALVLPPLPALAAFAGGATIGQLAVRRGPLKAVFNTSQFVTAATLAFLVVGAVAPGAGLSVARVCGALAGVVVFAFVNRTAVAVVLALAGAESFRSALVKGLGPFVFVLVGSASVGTLAGVAAVARPWTLPFALAATVALNIGISGHTRARRKREELATVVDSSPAGIFSVDRFGRVRAWNPAMERIAGCSAREVSGTRLDELIEFVNPDGSAADDLLAPPAADDAAPRRLLRLSGVGGSDRWLTVGCSQLGEGGLAFVAQDVTEQRQAELAVRTSEERLRMALDAGAMGWWEWDLGSGIVRWSENLERVFGLPPGGFGGTFEHFLAGVHPDDRELVQQTIEHGLAAGRYEFVQRIVRPDGEVRWLEGKGRVVYDADDRPVGMTGVGFDVTPRERAKALAALQARAVEEIATGSPLPDVLDLLLRLVEDHAGGDVGLVMLVDDDGRRLRDPVGLSLPAALHRAIDGIEIGSGAGACGAAAYHRKRVVVTDIASDPRCAPVREAALAHGLRACVSEPILSPAGDVLGVLALYSRRGGEPSADQLALAAVATHAAGIAIERARQEARLDRAEARYSRLVEHLPLAVYKIMPNEASRLYGGIRYLSPQMEAMLGYSRDQWMADDELYERILHPEDRERVLGEITRARATVAGFSGEYRLVAKDGRTVWVHDESVYIRGPGGALVAVEGYLVDVTQRKLLEGELLHAQKMDAVGRLAGGIAHDFNNMLTGVIGFSELALGRLDDAHPVQRHLEEIKRAGERASEMTHQLLAFSRKQVLQPALIDLNEVVAGAGGLLERLIGEDIVFTCVAAPDLEPIEADAAQLEQVVMNLAVNARDAMPNGGRLTIETANVLLDEGFAARHLDITPGPFVLLSVTDTGVGMDAETRARIFEPFFTTKEQGKGTGLGLATAFGIVKQSGGDIAVYSEPGIGTTFKIYLPAVEATRVLHEEPRAARELPRGGETVLLVEDEEVVRRFEREVLEALGYTVLEAQGATHALELAHLHEGSLDLLLTDVVMPGLNGQEVARGVTSLHPGIRVLYTSGYPGEAIVRHGVLEPGIAFLPKPITPDTLARRVREVLDATV